MRKDVVFLNSTRSTKAEIKARISYATGGKNWAHRRGKAISIKPLNLVHYKHLDRILERLLSIHKHSQLKRVSKMHMMMLDQPQNAVAAKGKMIRYRKLVMQRVLLNTRVQMKEARERICEKGSDHHHQKRRMTIMTRMMARVAPSYL